MKPSLLLSPLISLVMMHSLSGTQTEAFHQGQSLAAELMKGGLPQSDIASVLGPINSNPPETQWDDSQLESQAKQMMMTSDSGKFIRESHDAREQYHFEAKTDPIFQGANQILANPLEAIGGKGTKVVKINAPRETRTVACEEAGDPSQEVCKGRLNIKFVNQKKERTRTGNANIYIWLNGTSGNGYITCPDVYAGPCRALKEKFRPKGFVKFTINQPEDITEELRACAASKESTISFPFALDPKTIKKATLRSASVTNSCGVSEWYSNWVRTVGYLKAEFVITVIDEVTEKVPGEDEWLWACDDLEKRADQGLCTYETENCTVGQQTRWIDGVQVTRPCWEKTRTYLCAYPSKNDCGPLRAQGCYQTQSTCKKWVGKTCVVHTQTYQCDAGKNTGSIEVIQGGETPFCLDGNCADQSWESNDEMAEVLAQLSVLKDMQDSFRKDNVSLFKGEDDRCKKEAIGFKDCCKEKGWGVSGGLTECSPNEEKLRVKKQNKLCHFVGTYCDKKVLGKCITKKSTYCCFDSKLSRIFHEQGRSQIGLGWGDGKNPVCRGFTIEEIQRIDFSKMDLREIFEDVLKKYQAPNLQKMNQTIHQRMQDIQNSLTPLNGKNPPPQRKEA